jgi:hypothetical protein
MPWDCSCGVHVERDDETACPSCGQTKASWTLVADTTRTLSIAVKKAPLFRGASEEHPPRAAGLGAFEVVEASELVTLEKELVRQLAGLDLLPAPALLLVVRVAKAGDVVVVAEREEGAVEEQRFRAEGPGELRFLLVHGEGELEPDLVPAGVHVIDVGEPTPRGYAPALGVAALTKKRTTLPISAERRAFTWSM